MGKAWQPARELWTSVFIKAGPPVWATHLHTCSGPRPKAIKKIKNKIKLAASSDFGHSSLCNTQGITQAPYSHLQLTLVRISFHQTALSACLEGVVN